MKYKRKQLEVEAFTLGLDYIPDWFMDGVTAGSIILHGSSSGFDHHDDTNADILTFSGWKHADFGDMIVRYPDDTIIIPMKPDEFHRLYTKAHTEEEKDLVSVVDVSNKTAIEFALKETMKRFENSASESDQIIYNLLSRSLILWKHIKIHGIDMYGMDLNEFSHYCDEKRNLMFLTDEEMKNLDKAMKIAEVLKE